MIFGLIFFLKLVLEAIVAGATNSPPKTIPPSGIPRNKDCDEAKKNLKKQQSRVDETRRQIKDVEGRHAAASIAWVALDIAAAALAVASVIFWWLLVAAAAAAVGASVAYGFYMKLGQELRSLRASLAESEELLNNTKKDVEKLCS